MNNLVKDAARRRAKRNKPERQRMADFRRAVADIETIGSGVATAQTIARVALRAKDGVPFERMKRLSRLNVWELTAADEILKAHAISQGQSVSHDSDLGIRCDPRFSPDTGVVCKIDTLDRYREWQKDLAKTPALHAVMSILIDEVSLRNTEREHRWGNGTAFKHFQEGLRHFAALRGNTPRGVKWRYNRDCPKWDDGRIGAFSSRGEVRGC